MKIWTVSSCIPNERDPVIPNVFATEVAALAYLDEVMREEWETNAPEDDETGEPMAYPDDWQEAHDLMADNDPDETWGKWTLDAHDVPDPVRDAAPEMLAALKSVHQPYRYLTPEALESGVLMEFGPPKPEKGAALLLVRAAIAKAEGRSNG